MQRLPHTIDCERAKTLPLRVAHAEVTPAHQCSAQIVVAARGKVSQGQIADACGTAQQKVSAWEDADNPLSPSLARILMLAQGKHRHVAVSIAHAILTIADESPRTMRSLPELVCDVTTEHGDVAREVSTAIRDQHVTHAEAIRIMREIDEEMAALQQLRRAVDAAALVRRLISKVKTP